MLQTKQSMGGGSLIIGIGTVAVTTKIHFIQTSVGINFNKVQLSTVLPTEDSHFLQTWICMVFIISLKDKCLCYLLKCICYLVKMAFISNMR